MVSRVAIFCTGQSNFARQSILQTPAEAFPSNLKFWNGTATTAGTEWVTPDNTKMNSTWAFAREYAKANPLIEVCLITIAYGGLPIAHWLPNAPTPIDMFAACQREVTAALASIGKTEIDMLLWWQGESDAASPANYLANIEAVMTRFKAESWFRPTTPIGVFGIVGSAVNSNPVYANFERYLQEFVQNDPEFRMYFRTQRIPVSMWDDVLHASAEGYDFVGRMAFQEYATGMHRAAYGHGKFTPYLQFGSSEDPAIEYQNADGTCTRIGNLEVAFIRLTLKKKGTTVGPAIIKGLPRSIPSPVRSIQCGRYLNTAGTPGGLAGFATSSQIQLMLPGSTGVYAMTDANFTDTTDLWITVTYDF